MKRNNGITLIALIVTIVVLTILSGVTISLVVNDNGIIDRARLAEQETKQRIRKEELEILQLKEISGGSYLTDPVGSADFVQPWLFNEYTQVDMDDYVQNIKEAGFDTIILQDILETYGGDETSEVKIKNLWYDSNLQPTSEIEFCRTQTLDKLVNSVTKKGIKLYIGLALSDDWWDNKFEDNNWKIKNAQFINNVIDEIYNKYGNLECFAGLYYSHEMYTNTKQYELIWADMLNITINHIETLEQSSGKKINIMISPFISNIYEMEAIDVKQQWTRFMERINFRDNDIFCLQDGLGNSNFSPEKVRDIIIATKQAIKESDKPNVSFWINVENFKEDPLQPVETERFIMQLKISAIYAEKLTVFSYSHYYNPLLNNEKSKQYNEEYKKYYKTITGKELYSIPIPLGGSIYRDKNGMDVPVPRGFKVSTTQNVVNNGLVISDSQGNEFVWVPVKGGIKDKGYEYLEDEYKIIYYTRYLKNGVDINGISNDTLPSGVTSDEDQINKYKGFYIGRYESTFEYNAGNPRIHIKQGDNSKLNEGFTWQYADSDIYTQYLWNNISYTDAKNKAEAMSQMYGYDQTVSTGLINGTQWDSMLKWIHSNDNTYTKINNGTTWGNYTDSVAPATEGNYEQGVIKSTGTNENWKMNNIYDIAGNLAEWTSEKDSTGQYTIRSNSYTDNGTYGSPSYGVLSAPYQFKNVGFRVVLYIK